MNRRWFILGTLLSPILKRIGLKKPDPTAAYGPDSYGIPFNMKDYAGRFRWEVIDAPIAGLGKKVEVLVFRDKDELPPNQS